LTTLEVNQGGSGVAALLGAAALLPGCGRLGHLPESARRKQITVWHRTGRHDQVLRATSRLPDGAVSTYLILRASALNWMGSLDQAAQTADAARRQALKEVGRAEPQSALMSAGDPHFVPSHGPQFLVCGQFGGPWSPVPRHGALRCL
jgi:hypothetical protein